MRVTGYRGGLPVSLAPVPYICVDGTCNTHNIFGKDLPVWLLILRVLDTKVAARHRFIGARVARMCYLTIVTGTE